MEIYGPSHLHGAQSLNPPHSARLSRPAGTDRAEPIRDELQISEAARMAEVQESGDMAPIRQNRVDAIRAQIASGTYETPQKLDAALERLLDEIGGMV